MNFARIITGWAAVFLGTCVGGCVTEGPLAPMCDPYRPGESILLRWHREMSYRNSGTLNVEWDRLEMPVSVGDLGDGNGLLLSVRASRGVSGYEYTDQIGWKKVETMDSARPASEYATRADSYAEKLRFLQSVAFSARVNSQGHLAVFNAHGDPIDLGGNRESVGKEDLDYLQSHGVPDVIQALADSLAYLPPPECRIGQPWTVRRNHVMPGHQYGYVMMTGFGGSAKEESVCRCDWIELTGSGRVAVISICGTRIPEYLPDQVKRVPSLTVRGQLRFNLDTGRIERLRIENLPQWADPNEARQWHTEFVDTLSTENLRP